ncbi:MAG: alpha/beta hydrolase fold domain-containing protein [Aureliella sp.]
MHSPRVRLLALTVTLILIPFGPKNGFGDEPPKRHPSFHAELTYAERDTGQLKLDLYLPPQDGKSGETAPAPCVVFVHGGGWKAGNKKTGAKRAAWLTEHGFAVASIQYRLTDTAIWPAQIDDCYEAVRWLRKNAAMYKIAPKRIGVWGTSAGGHLAALMGTRPFPGDESISSRVVAVCDWFGPSELMTMPPNNIGPDRTAEQVAASNGAKLLGKTVREAPELAADASPLHHVSSGDGAFLIMHGQLDPAVPTGQSEKLHKALVQSEVQSTLEIIPDAGHGGKEFETPAVRKSVLEFFNLHLKSR